MKFDWLHQIFGYFFTNPIEPNMKTSDAFHQLKRRTYTKHIILIIVSALSLIIFSSLDNWPGRKETKKNITTNRGSTLTKLRKLTRKQKWEEKHCLKYFATYRYKCPILYINKFKQQPALNCISVPGAFFNSEICMPF